MIAEPSETIRKERLKGFRKDKSKAFIRNRFALILSKV
jgi:hypothetical protein